MRPVLDLVALRSFAAVAEVGGVTRAAEVLNLTQSAVSMQIKRLEEALDLRLLDRSGRGVALTPEGSQLRDYARRLLALNDEAIARLTDRGYEGRLTLGVPGDIVYPTIPEVLRIFAREYPRMRVNLISCYSQELRGLFDQGGADVILTTEDHCGPGGETLAERPLVWVGASGGTAWKERPLPLAFERRCAFRGTATEALDRAGIEWVMRAEGETSAAAEASISADLAIGVDLLGATPSHSAEVRHGGALPELGAVRINLYAGGGVRHPAAGAMADLLRRALIAAPVEVRSRRA